jgi:hypothetical protein
MSSCCSPGLNSRSPSRIAETTASDERPQVFRKAAIKRLFSEFFHGTVEGLSYSAGVETAPLKRSGQNARFDNFVPVFASRPPKSS